MKSATKHAEELRSLLKRLMKDRKSAPRTKLDSLRALVRGTMLFDAPEARVDEAMKIIDRDFCDLNELRVATQLEIQEILGNKYPEIERRAVIVTDALNAIFEKEHTLNLDRVAALGKRDTRQFLRDLPSMHPFVEAYVMLIAFEAPAMPLDIGMLNYLKEQGAVDSNCTLDDAQKFLEHHIKAEEMYDAFVILREASLGGSGEEGKKKKK